MRKYLILLLFAQVSAFSWFTGPLIIQNAEVVGKGKTEIEPFWFQFWVDGLYDEHWNHQDLVTLRSTNLQLCLIHGFAKNFDVQITPQVFTNSRGTSTSTRFGDLTLFLGFQLLEDTPNSWEPSLRFTINAPT